MPTLTPCLLPPVESKGAEGGKATRLPEATEAIEVTKRSYSGNQYRAKLPQTSIRTIPGDLLALNGFSESANKTPGRIVLVIPFPISGHYPHGLFAWLGSRTGRTLTALTEYYYGMSVCTIVCRGKGEPFHDSRGLHSLECWGARSSIRFYQNSRRECVKE